MPKYTLENIDEIAPNENYICEYGLPMDPQEIVSALCAQEEKISRLQTELVRVLAKYHLSDGVFNE